MRFHLFAISIVTLAWIIPGASAASSAEEPSSSELCALTSQPQVVRAPGEAPFETYFETNFKVLEGGTSSQAPLFRQHREWIRSFVDSDAIELLRRQRSLRERLGLAADVQRYDEILRGEFGAIRPAGCLESLLFERLLTELHTVKTGREFYSVLLSRGTEAKLYYVTGGEGYVTVPERMRQHMTQDVSQGWVIEAMIHNHPFNPANSRYDIGGGIIPSGQDLKSFAIWKKKYGTRSFWITNGFDTLIMLAEQIKDPEAN